MTTHTAERQELYKMIDTLPDDSVIAMRDFIRSLLPNAETTEWVDPIETGTWNAETMAAIKELDEGGGTRYSSAEELFKALDI